MDFSYTVPKLRDSRTDRQAVDRNASWLALRQVEGCIVTVLVAFPGALFKVLVVLPSVNLSQRLCQELWFNAQLTPLVELRTDEG